MAKKSVTKTKARTSTRKLKAKPAKLAKSAKASRGNPILPQLTTRVTGAFKNKAKAFAKTRGLKIGHLLTESLTVYMKGAPEKAAETHA